MKTNRSFFRCSSLLPKVVLSAGVVFLVMGYQGVHAAVKTWDGSYGGNWSAPQNWAGDAAPVNGDDLVFPAGAANLNNTNNNAVARLRSITFTGSSYAVWGFAVTVTNGISSQQAAGNNSLNLDVTLGASQTFECVTAGAWLTLNGAVGLGANTLTVSNSGNQTITGAVTGSGGITKHNSGFLVLAVSNSFSGAMTIQGGYVEVHDAHGLGVTNGGTVLQAGVLRLVSSVVAGESLQASGGMLQGIGASNAWVGPITLDDDITIDAPNAGQYLNLAGAINGAGGFTKIGPGTLILSGSTDNIYSGPTLISDGYLLMSKTSPYWSIGSGSLTVGDGAGAAGSCIARELGPYQIGSVPIIVNADGLLDLNNFDDTIGTSLTLNGGGDVQTGTGTLTLEANSTVTVAAAASSSSVSGKLNVGTGTCTFDVNTGTLSVPAWVGGSANIIKTGGGYMYLQASNSFTGTLTVDQFYLEISDPWALGGTGAGTFVSNSGMLGLSGNIPVGVEPLTLNRSVAGAALWNSGSSNSWSGPVTLSHDSTVYVGTGTFLNLAGIIGGAGGLTKTGTGEFIFSGSSANAYVGTTCVNAGTLSLARTGTDRAIPGDLTIFGTVRLLNSNQITNSGDVTINSSGTLQINGYWDYINGLSGAGTLDLGSGGLYVGAGSGSSTFDGVISGAGSFYKMGAGTLTLNGTNTLTGPTGVAEGPMFVNGFQPQSPVTVSAPASLGGIGVVGSITAYGYVLPGASPGILTCSNLSFSPAGDYFVELAGPTPGTDYDQLKVRGTNNLGDAALHVSSAFTTPVTNGHKFIIINNDGTDPITGTFLGWPEGTTLNANGFKLVISYSGGDGNDVVFTVTDVPAGTAGSTVSAGNGNHVIDPNECNNLDVVITNKTATPMTGISAVLSTTTPGAVVNQPYSDYPNVPANGNATNRTLFQVSTLPSFSGGSSINLQLTITSASHGDFTMPLSLTSGTTPGSGYCDSCLPAVSGSIATNDAVQTGRVTRDGNLSSCGQPKTWPGFAAISGERHYDSYTLTNTSGADACVTASLTNVCSPGLFVVAYLNAFNPADLSANYLGDAGASSGTMIFSINVPAGAKCVVVVHEIDPDVGCASYTLQWSGLPCPPPTLAINPVLGTNSVRIHWPTWAGGFELEATPSLTTTNWAWITNEPIIGSGRYSVTNSVQGTNRFYRLHRPP